MTDTLVVIPVRAGSAGIPNKALRLLAGAAPLERTIATAQQIGCDVVVTSNINFSGLEIATAQGERRITVVKQPPEVSGPDVPLDAPVAWATDYMERLNYPAQYRVVVTLQCTSPFTTVDTIRRCIAIASADCTAVTVRDDRGLRWESAKIDSPMLATRAPRRVVRQKMPSQWRETGAVFATPRHAVEPHSRFAHVVQLVEVSGREAIDLDTPEDWAIAEMYAGATERELLLARLLSERPTPTLGAQAVILSAYREGVDEDRARIDAASRWPDTAYLRGTHTHDEATIGITGRTGNDLVIVTSAYHMPRAFLTFLRVLMDAGLERTVRLWCAPVYSSMGKLSGEWNKIREYQAKGHCARFDEGLAYLDWQDSLKWSEMYASVA